jgi:hypothetical protein
MGRYCAVPSGRFHGLSIFPAEVLLDPADFEGSPGGISEPAEDEFPPNRSGFSSEDCKCSDCDASQSQNPRAIQLDAGRVILEGFPYLVIEFEDRLIAGAIWGQADLISSMGDFFAHSGVSL